MSSLRIVSDTDTNTNPLQRRIVSNAHFPGLTILLYICGAVVFPQIHTEQHKEQSLQQSKRRDFHSVCTGFFRRGRVSCCRMGGIFLKETACKIIFCKAVHAVRKAQWETLRRGRGVRSLRVESPLFRLGEMFRSVPFFSLRFC